MGRGKMAVLAVMSTTVRAAYVLAVVAWFNDGYEWLRLSCGGGDPSDLAKLASSATLPLGCRKTWEQTV